MSLAILVSTSVNQRSKMKPKKSKKITMNYLATSLDDLAAMVAKGFTDLKTEINGDVKDEIKGLRAEFRTEFSLVKEDTRQIRERLENMTPKFEHNALDKRVRKLEKTAHSHINFNDHEEKH